MARTVLYPGDPAPWFTARSSNNPVFNFDTAAGHYLVLSFLGAASHPKSQAVLAHINGPLRARFDDVTLSHFAVLCDADDERQQRISDSLPGLRSFLDFDFAISGLYGAVETGLPAGTPRNYRMFTLVLDPQLRVLATIPLVDPAQHNAQLTAVLDALPPIDAHTGTTPHAPVLILPRVFEPEFCRELINLYEHHGGEASGFMRQQGEKTVGILDANFKRRKDFMFEAQPQYDALRRAITARLVRRLVPEIKKAFQYDVTRIERYIVACYEGEDQGFFHRHRDNTTKGTAHRRFACTLNLNTGEYDGGELRFPEFGTRTYQAPPGGVVIFSCSLLHEATPVTRGKRYAFLPFLYDDTAAVQRRENEAFVQSGFVQKEG